MSRLLSVLLLLSLSTTAGAAAPWDRHTVDRSSRGADGVRLADVNGDGWMDIVTGWEEGGLIRVYVNPGPTLAKEPWPAVTVGKVKSPEDAVFVDLDGDKAMDVVSCCEGGNRTIYVHWAPADPTRYLAENEWQTAAIPCTGKLQMWMFALPLQVDDQQGVDLVVGSKGGDASISWLQSPAEPRELDQWQRHPVYEAGWIMSLQTHDMDADGDLDVLASDRKGAHRGVLWLANPGPASALTGEAWETVRIDQGDREVMFLTVADFHGRGERDVFCAVRGRGISHLQWRSGVATGWSQHEIAMPHGCGTGKGVAVGDMDGDGRNDLVFSCENARDELSGVRWLASDPETPGRWTDHEISGPEGTKYDRIELLDLDDDGDLDVLTCEERRNLGVIWYENPAR